MNLSKQITDAYHQAVIEATEAYHRALKDAKVEAAIKAEEDYNAAQFDLQRRNLQRLDNEFRMQAMVADLVVAQIIEHAKGISGGYRSSRNPFRRGKTARPGTGLSGTVYVYIQSESRLWTVGFYDPNGKWHSDSDHNTRKEAAARVHYLNGGN